ncbi:sn-glycerol-3-phosphate transport system permease protein UgpA [Pseudoruegeria aquimaris]|uniref:sn-glycerol-3-phosphate transport system permease protein UgpA n=1 Tax=Pseudoruegeria aquimaris TaxID=393663 RepID=A0A1Y5SAS6_9RHOB|nr:sugar ABC transporter permease [Pseudoruegeria aquimaris]SLN36485.1 sn-glycerol-3-phosphate transport system permease protein UgpA [Pseudoruegeria aquimaris]
MAKMSYNRKANLQRIALLTPGVLLFGIFNFLPLVALLGLSLVDWPGVGSADFVGLENFRKLALEPYYRDQFVNALVQNIWMFVLIIGSMLLLGSLLALLLSFGTNGRGAYRAIYFLPYPLAGAAVAFLLDLMVQPRGAINTFFVKTLGWWDAPIGFLGDTDLALPTLAMFYAWHRMSFAIVLILSAIVGVRVILLEAAMLDGASRWRMLKAVVFPVLAPAFVLITVIVMVDVFNNADYTLLLMGPEAGPLRSTDVLGTFLFRTSFGGSATSVNVNFGMAAAIGLVTAILILPAALFLALKNLRKD